MKIKDFLHLIVNEYDDKSINFDHVDLWNKFVKDGFGKYKLIQRSKNRKMYSNGKFEVVVKAVKNHYYINLFAIKNNIVVFEKFVYPNADNIEINDYIYDISDSLLGEKDGIS